VTARALAAAAALAICALACRAAAAGRLPQPTGVACFPCHSTVKFAKGPPFPHASAAHAKAGHCHVCHRGVGHQPKTIDRGACLRCHAEGSAPLRILPAAAAQPPDPAAPPRAQADRPRPLANPTATSQEAKARASDGTTSK
jgi:hypothetical protein